MIWSDADRAADPVLWGGLIAPGFDGASPSQIVGQVFGGDAVEAAHPFLEATVIGVDVIDMEMGSSGLRLAGSGRDVKRDVGFSGEGDDVCPASAPCNASNASRRCSALKPAIADSQAEKSSTFIESAPRNYGDRCSFHLLRFHAIRP